MKFYLYDKALKPGDPGKVMETDRPGKRNKEDVPIPAEDLKDDEEPTRSSEPTKIIAPEEEKKESLRSTEKHDMERARVIRGRGDKTRFGRGFSLRELTAGGISLKTAKKLNIFIDVRRTTKHEENVNQIKGFFSE